MPKIISQIKAQLPITVLCIELHNIFVYDKKTIKAQQQARLGVSYQPPVYSSKTMYSRGIYSTLSAISNGATSKRTVRLAHLETLLWVRREVCSSNSGSVKSNTISPKARHRCDISSQLCHPGVKLRGCAELLVKNFGEIPRVARNKI